jgi:hypothetical protein
MQKEKKFIELLMATFFGKTFKRHCQDFIIYCNWRLTKREGRLNVLALIFIYSQIWLNLLIDDCYFGYIKKLENKPLAGIDACIFAYLSTFKRGF